MEPPMEISKCRGDVVTRSSYSKPYTTLAAAFCARYKAIYCQILGYRAETMECTAVAQIREFCEYRDAR